MPQVASKWGIQEPWGLTSPQIHPVTMGRNSFFFVLTPQRVSEAMCTGCLTNGANVRHDKGAKSGVYRWKKHKPTSLFYRRRNRGPEREECCLRQCFQGRVTDPRLQKPPGLLPSNRRRVSRVRAGRPRKATGREAADLGLPPASSPVTGHPSPAVHVGGAVFLSISGHCSLPPPTHLGPSTFS